MYIQCIQVSLSAGVSGRENRNFELVLTNGSNAYTLDTSTGMSVFGECQSDSMMECAKSHIIFICII